MTLYDRIKERRKALGLSQSELASILGYEDRSSISKIESGINDLTQSKIEEFAAALQTTPAYLMGWDNAPPSNISPMPSTKKIPRLGAIACGEPVLAVENLEDHDEVPDYVKCDFTLKCKGDSMVNARIYDGDIVCIRQQPTVESGEIAAVIINGEATLKRVKFAPNQIILWPENSNYEPMIFVGEQMNSIRILGKATHFISKVK